MSRSISSRPGIGRLEVVLLLATIALVFQLLPGLWQISISALWSAIDMRNWSRTTWFVANLGVLALLVGVRFAPDAKMWFRSWRERRRLRAALAEESHADSEYEKRRERDEDWRQRAKKRLPWHQ